MLTSIAGKSVIVTGASKGIGKGIAAVFAKQGGKVLVVARHLDLPLWVGIPAGGAVAVLLALGLGLVAIALIIPGTGLAEPVRDRTGSVAAQPPIPGSVEGHQVDSLPSSAPQRPTQDLDPVVCASQGITDTSAASTTS